MDVLVVAATNQELSLLIGQLDQCTSQSTNCFAAYSGQLGSHQVVIAASGMGKVNTAICLTALLEQVKPGMLISTGCAGAFTGCDLEPGDLAISSGMVYGDEGVLTPGGWQPLELIGIPFLRKGTTRYFNEYPVCEPAVSQATALAERLGIPARVGRSVTVSTCSGTTARGTDLRDRFGAITENMEGAAAAHVALTYDVPFLEIRGISNLVEDRDISRWNIPLATETVQHFLAEFVRTI